MSDQVTDNSATGAVLDALDQHVLDVVNKRLAEMGGGMPKFKGPQQDEAQRWVDNLTYLFQNSGHDRKGRFVPFGDVMRRIQQKYVEAKQTDAASSPDIQLILPRTISQVVMEPIPYEERLAPLLKRINIQGPEHSITFPAVGAMGGLKLDMAEGDEYPEGTLDFAGTTHVKVGKSGIAVRITDEMRKYSIYDFMRMLLNAAGRALARWKEKKIADWILRIGITFFDNANAAYPCTTGRDFAGEANGTFVLDDLFSMFADMITEGFTPNTLIMHPMAWLIFARDPQMRHLASIGRGGAFWQTPSGQSPYAKQFEGAWGAAGASLGLGGESALNKLYTPVPGLFPVPLEVIVTPAIGYRMVNGKPVTDIIMCDRNELGMLFVEEEPVMEEWDDPARDITKIKMRERFGIGVLNAGHGARIAKNVVIDRAFDWESKADWIAGSGDLSPIPTTIV